MKTTSFSELRRNLSSVIDGVAEDHEPIVITRGAGKPSAVIMSLEDFASYEETHYLLRSPANAKRLRKAVNELDKDIGSERQLIE
ncbi:MAG: type II toxin-antitoxin system prevent-host-death family antitoxin [Pseudomonadota bacterium]